MKKNFKMMMRIVCCLLSVCFVASAFAPCGKKNSNNNKPDDENPSASKPGDPTPGDPTSQDPVDPSVDEDPAPITLNIGTYNIANGRQVNHKMIMLAKDIVDQNLDVVGLQEVDQFCDRSGNMDTMKTLSELTGMKYYTFFKAINLGSGEYGVGVLSRYPIVEQERIALYSTGEQRVLGRTKIDVNGTQINFFTTHLEWSPDATRNKEMLQLNDYMAQYDNFVFVGDFNVHDLSEYRALDYKGMVNTEEKPILTYSSTDGDWYLDNIIYSPEDWTFTEGKTLPNGHSDHFLLWSTGTFLPTGRETVKDSSGKELPTLPDGKKATAENIGKWAEGTKGAYVEIDLGAENCISAVKVINAKTCDSVYKWAVYGTEDATLPIEKWTKLAEKATDEKATGAGYTATVSKENAKLPFRYVRIYATYHSGDENYQIAEVSLETVLYKDGSANLLGNSTTIKTDEGKTLNSLKDGVTDKYVPMGEWGKNCYLDIDLGRVAYLTSVKMYNPIGDGNNVYKWTAYATNDATLPIEKWTKLGEKAGEQVADSQGYTIKLSADAKKAEFRYVRIYGTYSSDNKKFNVCEVLVNGKFAPDLSNLALTATAIAGKGGECEIVNDGDTSKYFDLGYWCDSDENEAAGIPVGTAGTCYIELDLQALYKLESIQVINLINSTRVYKWTAFATDDNVKPIDQWTELGGKTNNDTAAAEGYTLTLSADHQKLPFRYIRIYGMYHNTNWGYHINEVFVKGIAKA